MLKKKKKSLPQIRVSENLQLLLVSLALAFVAWMIAKTGDTEETRIQVPVLVTINDKRPDARFDVRVNPQTIPVTLRSPKAVQLSSENLYFEVDASSMREGLGLDWKSMSLRLSEKNWVANVPERWRVRLEKIGGQTNTVEILMRWRAVPAEIKPDITGEDRLPQGMQLAPVKVSPKEIWIVGEPQVLDTLERDPVTSKMLLRTERIDVSNRTGAAPLQTVLIRVPPGVEIVQPATRTADVTVDIQEVQTERVISGLKIDYVAANPDLSAEYKEHTASVKVYGPATLLQQLGPQSLEIGFARPAEELAGMSSEVTLEPRFAPSVGGEDRTKMTIRQVTPKWIKVRFQQKQSPSSK